MFPLEYKKLADEQIQQGLLSLDGWAYDGSQIVKTYSFSKYPEGPAFAVKVGELAEELNHHPDILITWCKVRVSMNTHDVSGISPYDFELAKRIDLA
ncbi:MAG: 4a-hydroxytetrahydrobiopterin dehydratase [Fimbriimonadaceae bacterium]|nr:4a-hydroxytetrahydrobiopterin dehydratase [Fimbriimonadaceae bacterium]